MRLGLRGVAWCMLGVEMLKQISALSVLAVFSLTGCASVNEPDRLCPASGCTEPSRPSGDAKALLRNAGDIALGRGFRTNVVSTSGRLDSGKSNGFPYLMMPGRKYLLVGLCDMQCADLDAGIYHVEGTEIASDTAEDAIPIVEISPDEEMTVIIRIKMIRCDWEPCQYGVGVYRQ